LAKTPMTKKPVAKAQKPVVAAPAKTAVAAPSPVKKAVAPVKPVVAAAPVAAKPAPVATVAPKVEVPKPAVAATPRPEWKVAQPQVDVVAPKPAPAPVVAEAAKIEAPKPEVTKTEPAAPPVAVAAPVKGPTMNDTVKNVAEDFQTRATAAFGDMNTRAKDAMSKGTKAIEELVEFSKGNVEALVASGRVAAKGAEDIAKYSAEYGRTSVEKANATAKQFAAVKSPTEFFQLQGDVAKQTLDALVAEGSKFTESYLKLLGEIAQPISNRVAVAAEKVKSTVAA
jgi:phasin family protein